MIVAVPIPAPTHNVIKPVDKSLLSKIEILDVSKICAAAIERSLIGQSLSELMVL